MQVSTHCQIRQAGEPGLPLRMEADAAAPAEPPLEQPAKKRKGEKGNPPGIFDHNSGDKQARLLGVKVNGKAYERPIPGRYKSIEEAAAAQAVAYQKFATGRTYCRSWLSPWRVNTSPGFRKRQPVTPESRSTMVGSSAPIQPL